jgi:hypothetical protein
LPPFGLAALLVAVDAGTRFASSQGNQPTPPCWLFHVTCVTPVRYGWGDAPFARYE